MLLNQHRVSRLTENQKQLVVRKEKKPREQVPFIVQVLLQGLQDIIQFLIVKLESLEQLLIAAVLDDGVLERLAHDVLPETVHHVEFGGLVGHLLLDVGRAEDGLQVHPGALAHQPLLDRLINDVEVSLPRLHLLSYVLHVARAQHRLDRQLMLVDRVDDLLNA